ncbi:DUF397 domain-containing protein [Amycolatopsis rhabdoformis]|uniref:DUF397 domain-containing protein n=1 Tax=Amycolatopsis rhabdoformis TaxID=1448059 RepID=A0ABZ1I8A8_9PSEU|nr:DUF397 domain-containing protein [Amycolatopsis rhabdoformis]WSE30661.1 DUF397 domain-containing protein [Amycolatopsis rhabdoformis]
MIEEFHSAEWRKSSYSGANNNCVEAAVTAAGAGIRDTKDRAAGHLTATRDGWSAFLAEVGGEWRKSSRSQNTSNCVEVAVTATGAGVRDTKQREAGHLATTRDGWSAFLAQLGR